jgi:hypothetical protein
VKEFAMKSWIVYAVAFVLALGVGSLGFAAQDKKDKPKPEDQFKKMDKDGNGKLSLDEFVGKKKDEKKTKAEEAFKKMDKDNDSSLSLEEFTAKGKKKDK